MKGNTVGAQRNPKAKTMQTRWPSQREEKDVPAELHEGLRAWEQQIPWGWGEEQGRKLVKEP